MTLGSDSILIPSSTPPAAAALGIQTFEMKRAKADKLIWSKPQIREAEAPAVPIELKGLGLTQREVLLDLCDSADFWRSPDGETFASVQVGDHIEHLALHSRTFKDWLLGQLAVRYVQNGRPASVGETAVREARQALEARSHIGGNVQEAPLRVAEHRGGIFIDRGSSDWSAFHIRGDGWDVVQKTPVPILRSRRTGALPDAASADLGRLRRLLARLSDADFVLFVSWCLGTLAPRGPYPILIVSGEAGAGKSTIVRLAQRLVDPVAGDLLQPPGDDRDLIAAAKNGRVLAFDNLSNLKPEMADSLCRLATGSEIGGRALYSDYDTATFSACRPIILNGIPDLASRGDLADRSIVIRLNALETRVTEREWRREVEAVLPSAFAGLLDALSAATRRFDIVPTPNVRMADFAKLVVAAEPALPWKAGAFLEAYRENRQQAIVSIIEGDLVASQVLRFAREQIHWTGLKSLLHAKLTEGISIEAKRSGDWPGNARWFSDRLRRVIPALRAMGIEITERRGTAGQTITIGAVDTLATLDTQENGPFYGDPVANAAHVASGTIPLSSSVDGGVE